MVRGGMYDAVGPCGRAVGELVADDVDNGNGGWRFDGEGGWDEGGYEVCEGDGLVGWQS